VNRARIKWVENLKFIGNAPSGHSILMDGSPEAGGDDSAIRPGEMTIVALGGCTGIDVISMLKKMRVEIESFEVVVDAEPRAEYPKSWATIHVKYLFKGKNIDPVKVKKAIDLSEEKYCMVSAMLKKSAELTYDFEIINTENIVPD
jgi:putative redox protein